MQIYVFDGSFAGFLTLLFEWYTHKPGEIEICKTDDYQTNMMDETIFVQTDESRADRVSKGLQKKLSKDGWRRLYCTFLSEMADSLPHLFRFARYVLDHDFSVEKNYGHPDVLYIAQMARKVEREKHHIEAFVRFEQTPDGLHYAPVSPKYNVLPLIVHHFKNRYSSQSWVIYDLPRKYGIFYNGQNVQYIQMQFTLANNRALFPSMETKESAYQQLWKTYFNSTNIEARKNLKLQAQSMPKRFWKYLTEMRPD